MECKLEVAQEKWESSVERSPLFTSISVEVLQEEWESSSLRSPLFRSMSVQVLQEEWEASPQRSPLFRGIAGPPDLALTKLSPAMGKLNVDIQHSPQGVGDFAWIGGSPSPRWATSPKRNIISMPILELA